MKRKHYEREAFFEPLKYSLNQIIFQRIVNLCEANNIYSKQKHDILYKHIIHDLMHEKENIKNSEELLNIVIPNLFLENVRNLRTTM